MAQQQPPSKPYSPEDAPAFPKWKHHAEHAPRVIHSAEEEEELGDEWADNPDAAKLAAAKKAADEKPAATDDKPSGKGGGKNK